jgi:hypothetical protein
MSKRVDHDVAAAPLIQSTNGASAGDGAGDAELRQRHQQEMAAVLSKLWSLASSWGDSDDVRFSPLFAQSALDMATAMFKAVHVDESDSPTGTGDSCAASGTEDSPAFMPELASGIEASVARAVRRLFSDSNQLRKNALSEARKFCDGAKHTTEGTSEHLLVLVLSDVLRVPAQSKVLIAFAGVMHYILEELLSIMQNSYQDADAALCTTLALDEVADLVSRLARLSRDEVTQVALAATDAAGAAAHEVAPAKNATAQVRERYDWLSFDHAILAILNDEDFADFFDVLGFAASIRPWSCAKRTRMTDCLVLNFAYRFD